MKVLHYSLGFPPYRTGGLTKFCIDLMKEQVLDGIEVALLWPGEIRTIHKETKIIKRNDYEKISSYEIINPLPVPYDEGIEDVELFIKRNSTEVFEKFLCKYKPNVIHIHTFMGLHKEFLVAANRLNIKMVFSVHDFFSICPKITLFRDNKICESSKTCNDCYQCNSSALSYKKMTLLQSHFYMRFKNNGIVKKMRKIHRDAYLSEETKNVIRNTIPKGSADDYISLRKYYSEMLELVDIVHYNSNLTKIVYEQYFKPKNSIVINITHGDIQDHRKIKEFDEILSITYLGPQSSAKGYYLLIKSLDVVYKLGYKFKLNVYFQPKEDREYINSHPRYSYTDLEKIFDDTDLLIAPSLLIETFGYTVIEALSYGVPVIISDNVGAKDIIKDDCGVIIDNIDIENLTKVILNIDRNRLVSMNKKINDSDFIFSISEMNKIIKQNCY